MFFLKDGVQLFGQHFLFLATTVVRNRSGQFWSFSRKFYIFV